MEAQERKDRYNSKLEKIENRLFHIEKWMENVSEEEFSEELQLRLSVYKAIQEVAEAITDISAMYLADQNKVVGDDYENLEKCSGQLFPKKLKNNLINLNGLRNRIVHEYDKINHSIAYKGIKDTKPAAKQFKEEVSKWIKQK